MLINMLEIIQSVPEWQKLRQSHLFDNKKIGLVPTMGNLHKGHQSLLQRSVAENAITVLTLFVNPTQFDDAGDLKNYPRTFEQDVIMAKEAGVDFILAPEYGEIYPDNYRYKISENEFSQQLCGKHRKGHFAGVLTAVLKLFQLVRPCKAYFGEKDFQQLQLISDMVKAFFLDIEVIPCAIVRDENGLALSSRNSRLTAEQYQQALAFPKLLSSKFPIDTIINHLQEQGFAVDYIEEYNERRFGAVRLGHVRLIDNFLIG